MSSESVGASTSSTPKYRLTSSQRRFVSDLLNILGVVALVAATPLLLLLLRLAVSGRSPVGHPALQLTAGLLMLVTVAALHLGMARWLDGSRWRENKVVRYVVLAVPALALVAGVYAVVGAQWGWLVAAIGASLLYVLWRAELFGWSRVFSFTTGIAVADGDAFGSAPVTMDGECESNASDDSTETTTNEHVRQRIERRIVDGRELISVWQRVEFPAFARATTLHIPFWPPLAEVPVADSEVVCDVDARVTIEQLELHGCRVKVQLDEADERPQHAELEILFTAGCETVT